MFNTELRFALDGHVFPLIKSSAHCFEAVYVLLWMCNLVPSCDSNKVAHNMAGLIVNKCGFFI